MPHNHYCPTCNSIICDLCGSLRCRGICGLYFHVQCINLTKPLLLLIKSCSNISWKCIKCCSLPRLKAIERLTSIGSDLGQLKNEVQIVKTNQAQAFSIKYFDSKKLKTLCPCHCIPDISDGINKFFETLNEWSFDVFSFSDATKGKPVMYIGYKLMQKYNFIKTFQISPISLMTFLNYIEDDAIRSCNPYHNNKHSADVAQTVNWLIEETGLKSILTDLEIFSVIIAALVHDFKHTGTSNNFHVMTKSNLAMLYNDKSVLENFHASSFFRLLRDEKSCNFLVNLTPEEFREFRKIVIRSILLSDISNHQTFFETYKNDGEFNRNEFLSLILHCADISNSSKNWPLCYRWTNLLMIEFFHQGDVESALGLPQSFLFDRQTVKLPEVEINFIDSICKPIFELLTTAMEVYLKTKINSSNEKECPWIAGFENNKKMWLSKVKK